LTAGTNLPDTKAALPVVWRAGYSTDMAHVTLTGLIQVYDQGTVGPVGWIGIAVRGSPCAGNSFFILCRWVGLI